MRLGTCIALELVVAAGALGGVAFGVVRATELAGTYLVAPVAEAATTPVALPTPLPRAELGVRVTVPAAPTVATVFGAPDSELLAPLGASAVTKVRVNHGGTSLSLRIEFASGARAAFKPEQTFLQSDPRREIAAYRIDRLLGIGRVPPAKPASIPLADIMAVVEPGYRAFVTHRLEAAVARNGVLHGELSWWVPEIKRAKLGRYFIDDREGRDHWVSLLQIGAAIPPELEPMLGQIAAVVLFDVLIDNADRWSGNNTQMSPDGTQLFFMDNTLAFSIYRLGHPIPNTALRRIQVFPRGLVEKLRALTLEGLDAALASDSESPLGQLLTPNEVRAVLARRDNILMYIDGLVERHGEAAVLAFP